MGILVPLYLAGLTALSLPLIFHLVRRTPRGRQEFSSLMFLSPTVPRLTRRSRLDQIVLLLLRLAALALVALAFSRPFLREAASLSFADLTGKRLAILVDTSASMKRGDLWQQAVKAAEKQLDDLNPQDDVALFAFSDRLRTIVDFQEEGAAPIADKPQVVRNHLKKLAPDWGSTDLGTALVTVAGELDNASDVRQSPLEPQIVVISDFQSGSRIEALQSFEWPECVPLVTQRVSLANTTNAHAQVLPTEAGHELTDVRVRVVNATDSSGDQFTIRWESASGGREPSGRSQDKTTSRPTGELTLPASQSHIAGETPVYVPAGQSRVIRLPRGTNGLQANRIVLRGDDHDFDNTFFVVPPRTLKATLVYSGRDAADDPEGLQLYLRLAVANDPLRQVEVRPLEVDKLRIPPGDAAPEIIVVSQSISDELRATLTAYVEQGGLLLLVPHDDTAAMSLLAILEDVEVRGMTRAESSDGAPRPESSKGVESGVAIDESDHALRKASGRATQAAGREEYQLLGEIDFRHPLFAPFASPRYSDFTKIHFWKHRPVTLKTPATTQVVARFDNGDPALLERSIGEGRVLALTSGWQPDDSQLALSSKFVPLVGALLDLACGGTEVAESVSVGQPVTLFSRRAGDVSPPVGSESDDTPRTGRLTPPASQNSLVVVQTPDGREIRLDADGLTFTETDQPGIYQAKVGSTETQFAVNLSATESNTAPLDLEQLEQRGVRLGVEHTRAERIDRVRQQRDTELESRQKVWRWLIVVALGTLILETWWAGRAERQIMA